MHTTSSIQSTDPADEITDEVMPYADPLPRRARFRVPSWLLELLIRLPLLAVSVYVCWMTFDSLATLGLRPYPLTSWESSYVVQGEALRRGGIVYNMPAVPNEASRLAYPDGDPRIGFLYNGPAPNMYGPALPHVLSWIFRFTGPTLYAGRIVTLCGAAILLVLGYLALPQPARRSPVMLLTLAALVFANHVRARAFFMDVRPDVVAIAMTGIGLSVLWWCHERRRLGLYPLGLAFIVVGFLFKQTVAPLTAVPMIGVLVTRPRGWLKKDLWLTLLCPIVVLATVEVLKYAFPVVYYYAFFMPTRWRFVTERYWYAPWNALVFFPIIFVALVYWSTLPRRPRSSKMWWLFAATGVGLAAASVYFSKRGGSYNSYLMTWIPGSMLVAVVVGRLLTDPRVRFGTRAAAIGLIVPIALMASTFGIAKSQYFSTGDALAHGSDKWASVIDLTSRLPGRLNSFGDPTITLFSRGKIASTLQTETDGVANAYLPEHIVREIRRSDWVVDVHSNYSMYLTDVDLWRLGFDPVDVPMLRRSNYRLWKKINGDPEEVAQRIRVRRRYEGPAVYHVDYEPLRAGYFGIDAVWPDEPIFRPGWKPPAEAATQPGPSAP